MERAEALHQSMKDDDFGSDMVVRVKIHSLQGSTHLNGRTGVVNDRSISLFLDTPPVGALSSSDEGGGRVCVQLDGRQLLIRRANLTLVTQAQNTRPMRRLQLAVANSLRSAGSPSCSTRRRESCPEMPLSRLREAVEPSPGACAAGEPRSPSAPRRRERRGKSSHVTFAPIDICVPVDNLYQAAAEDKETVATVALGPSQRSRYHTRVFSCTRSADVPESPPPVGAVGG